VLRSKVFSENYVGGSLLCNVILNLSTIPWLYNFHAVNYHDLPISLKV